MNAVLEEKNDLPEGWKLKLIGEIVQPTRPRISPSEKPELPFLGMDHIEAQTMRMLGSVPASTMKSSAVHFQPGDVLYGRLRPYLNKVYQPHFEGLCSAEFIVFPEVDELDNKYLQYFLNSSTFVRHATSLNSGDRPRVKFEQLAPYEIPLPPTVEQQKRIVAKIEELFSHIDAGIEVLKKAKQLLKQYRQSVLKAAVTGELTKEWREVNKDKLEPASQLLERILKERRQKWEEQQLQQFKAKGKMPKDDKWKQKYKEPVSLDNRERPSGNEYVCEVNIDALAFVTKLAGFEYTKFVKYDDDGDLSVIKAENAGPFGYKVTDYSKVRSETVEHLTRSKVHAGDLLMVFVGAGTANVAIVPDDQPYFLGPNIAMIRIESSYALQEYLEIYLRSSVGKGAAMSFAKAVAQPSLSMGSIRMIPVLLPNVEEQKVIVDVVNQKIDSLSRLEDELETQLLKAERNKQSILASAFSGGLQ